MCGIFCCCGCCFGEVDDAALTAGPLGRRGPDHTEVHRCPSSSNGPSLILAGSVLHHRGPFTPQPLVSEDGGVALLWNGEIFDGVDVPAAENDGRFLLSAMAATDPSESAVLDLMGRVRGPFAFVLYHRATSCLLFGRDALGRRSLILNASPKGHLHLCSVPLPSSPQPLLEVPPLGIFTWRLDDPTCPLLLRPWDIHVGSAALSETQELCGKVVRLLSNSSSLPSGLMSNSEVSPFPELPLIVSSCDGDLPSLATNIQRAAAARLLHLLRSAVQKRVELTRRERKSDDARVAVLFSGGVDCATVAALADHFVPREEPIDLLNVAFARPGAADFEVPDRQTAKATLEELQTMSPHRHWRFVAVDVTLAQLQAERRQRIAALVRPAGSVLDDSLGCAVWFAAGGDSAARLVLSGAGADELLGGYSRHRAVYDRGGLSALEAELEMEVRRIGSRNLGRDDRVVGDHGRELRLPFLDEEVVNFVRRTPVDVRANLSLGRGFGEKMLLRLAAWQLGLRKAACLPKRAIQFGSRIAKAEGGGSERGDMACVRLATTSP